MKKNQIITVILVLVLILSLVIAITSCNSRMNADTEPTETANETVETEKEISEVETTDAASTEIEETEETKYSVSSAIDHEAMLLAQIEKRVKREKVTPASYQKVQEDAPTPSEETPAASSPAPQEPSQESAPAPAQPAQPPEPVHTHSYSTGKSATCTENGYTVCSGKEGYSSIRNVSYLVSKFLYLSLQHCLKSEVAWCYKLEGIFNHISSKTGDLISP